MKKYMGLLLALVMCLSMAACSSSGRKWSDTDVIDDYGTVTRNGKQIDVCVTHDQKTIYFYYDDEDHKLLDTAKLPTDEIYDKDWLLGNIIFSDFTGDNDSDLQVYLEHADMSESYIVWTWEEGEGYVYQPYDSWFYHSIVVRDPTYDDEFGIYEGVWLSYPDNPYDDIYYIEFDRDGSWQLHSEIDVIDDGYLYTADDGFTYVYSYQEGEIGGGYIELDGDQLYISTLGYFSHLVSEDDLYNDDDSGNGDDGEVPELHHQDISEFQGTWYYDYDLSAETYIIIDGDGNWSYYQRAPGDAEGTEMDYGTFSYSTEDSYVYYADSAMYDDVRYQVLDFDEGILIWGDEGTYYRMED